MGFSQIVKASAREPTFSKLGQLRLTTVNELHEFFTNFVGRRAKSGKV
jgi:hypothetical protein